MQTPQSGTGLVIYDWVEAGSARPDQFSNLISIFRRGFWVCLAVVMTVEIGSALWPLLIERRLSTQTGVLGYAELPDGSMALLNTNSKIALRFTRNTRLVRVLEGQVLFDVAPDTHRVFVVEAGNLRFEAPANSSGVPRRNVARIGALVDYARDIAVPLTDRSFHTLFATRGNTFTLRRGPDETVELAVLEGSIKAGGEEGGGVTIGEDTVGHVSDRHGLKVEMKFVKNYELEAEIAWLDRRIVIAGDHTLRDVAAEFNRYNKVQILFEGTTGDQQIRGSFNTDDPYAFV